MTMKMTYNGTDLRFPKKVGGKMYNRVIPLCDSRPLPEFRDSSTQVEGADGEWFDSLTIGPREFTVTLVAHGVLMSDSTAIQQLAREIGRAFVVREPKRFVFGDELDPSGNQLYRLAVPTGAFDAEQFIRAGRWTCRFRQPDPFLYGFSHTEKLEINSSGKGVAKTIDVGGNAPAYLTATTMPKSGVKRYELKIVGGQGVAFEAAFDDSTELKLNFRNQTARITQTNKNKSVPSANGLDTGSRFFTFDGSLKMVANSLTTLTWTERWV